MNKMQRLGIVLAVGLAIWFFPPPANVNPNAWKLFAIFVATILGFILQPYPMGMMALAGIGITLFTRVLPAADTLAGFSNTVIWLIVTSFLFSRGFIKTGLGKRIAYTIIRAIGSSTLKLGYATMLSELIISPVTPSNTARSGGIMLPIVRSLAASFGSEPGDGTSRRVGSYLMINIFQCCTITTGMFVTASASNPVMINFVAQTANVTIDWTLWALVAVVPGAISLLLVPYVLYKLYPPELTDTPQAKTMAAEELKRMGPMARDEKIISGIFLTALVLWSTSQLTGIDATAVAVMGAVAMLAFKVIEWNDVLGEKGAWDSMMWMGGLVGLAGGLNKLGLIAWFTKTVSAPLAGFPWVYALAALVLIYLYAHYAFASLAAHIGAMFTAFLAICIATGAPPYLASFYLIFASNLMMGLTHYAAGPAPIYFGAGYVPQGTWWRLGFILSIMNIVIWYGIGSLWMKILGLW